MRNGRRLNACRRWIQELLGRSQGHRDREPRVPTSLGHLRWRFSEEDRQPKLPASRPYLAFDFAPGFAFSDGEEEPTSACAAVSCRSPAASFACSGEGGSASFPRPGGSGVDAVAGVEPCPEVSGAAADCTVSAGVRSPERPVSAGRPVSAAAAAVAATEFPSADFAVWTPGPGAAAPEAAFPGTGFAVAAFSL